MSRLSVLFRQRFASINVASAQDHFRHLLGAEAEDVIAVVKNTIATADNATDANAFKREIVSTVLNGAIGLIPGAAVVPQWAKDWLIHELLAVFRLNAPKSETPQSSAPAPLTPEPAK